MVQYSSLEPKCNFIMKGSANQMREENIVGAATSGIKVCVIGVGNGGSQVAIAATSKGIPSMVFNTSEKDLADDLIGKNIKGYLIGDGRGSGKDRENAMALLKANGKAGLQEIFVNPFFKEMVEPADVVFVTFSTGGGTGSGIGPTLAKMIHLAYNRKVLIPYGILPKNAESVMAQANTIACVDDMTKLGTPYMLADLSFYENEPQEKAFQKIGEYIAETMAIIRGDYMTMSTHGMADERDILTVISEPGYLGVWFRNGITEAMLQSGKTLEGYIVDAMKASPMCRFQRDGYLQYNLVATNVNSIVEDPLKNGDYSELNQFAGEPKATYANYAVDDTITEFNVTCIVGGMSIPMDRFTAAKAKVKANRERYEKHSAISLDSDREATSVKGNESTRSQIMGSANSATADLSFLDNI